MPCPAFCSRRTGSGKCIYFSRVYSLLLLILHLRQVRVSITRQDIWTFLKKQVKKVQGGKVLVGPERDMYGAEHLGATVSEAVETGRKALRETGRLFRAKSHLIWLFISNKAGFSPEGCSTNSQLAFSLCLPGQGVVGRIVGAGPWGNVGKKIRHWEGFHF